MSVTERKHVPEPATVLRLEIFTGAGRRRTWPAEAKARIVAESLAPGATACGVARRHGLTPQQLFAWRRAARQQRAAGDRDERPSFVPVLLEPAPKRRARRGSSPRSRSRWRARWSGSGAAPTRGPWPRCCGP